MRLGLVFLPLGTFLINKHIKNLNILRCLSQTKLFNSIISYQDTLREVRTQKINLITVREQARANTTKYKLFPNLDEFINLITIQTRKLLNISSFDPIESKHELFFIEGQPL